MAVKTTTLNATLYGYLMVVMMTMMIVDILLLLLPHDMNTRLNHLGDLDARD